MSVVGPSRYDPGGMLFRSAPQGDRVGKSGGAVRVSGRLRKGSEVGRASPESLNRLFPDFGGASTGNRETPLAREVPLGCHLWQGLFNRYWGGNRSHKRDSRPRYLHWFR